MENETQQNIPSVKPISQTSPTAPSFTNWSKILLFAMLGLIIIAGSIFIGIQIGKNQTFNQQSIVVLPTISPAKIVASSPVTPKANPTTDLTANWKTYTNTEAGFSFKYPQNWKAVPSCKFGTICFSGDDFQVTVNEVGDGGGLYVASGGGLFSVSTSPKTIEMKLDDICRPGGPLIVSSCIDTSLDGVNAKKRIEVLQSNVEYATVIGALTNKYYIIISQNYGSQDSKTLLDQILSTFKFN